MGSEHKVSCVCGACEDRRAELSKLRAENARLRKAIELSFRAPPDDRDGILRDALEGKGT
jgi:hypothetical protein